MKRNLLVLVVIFLVVGAIVGITGYGSYKEKEKLAAQQAEFEVQQKRHWNQIVNALNLFPLKASDSRTLQNFASFEFKQLNEMEFLVNSQYREEARRFMRRVHFPAKSLFLALSTKVTPERSEAILALAREVDNNLDDYSQSNPELKQFTQIAAILESKLKSIVIKEKPVVTKIIVVNSGYPSWVSNSEQRESYSSMRDIARRYLQSRMTLAKRLNWSRARGDSSYLRQSDVRSIIADAWNLRKELRSELSNASRVEGMSNLASLIDQMLMNSLDGLAAIYDHGDYPTFKSLNNVNDRLAKEIRNNYGVEMW